MFRKLLTHQKPKNISDAEDNGNDILTYIISSSIMLFIYIPLVTIGAFSAGDITAIVVVISILGAISGLAIGSIIGYVSKKRYLKNFIERYNKGEID